MCGVERPAPAQTRPVPDLATATIEDLMRIVVTTASRAPEGLAAAPARVQVVTAAQIERRGYRSILDVLKDLAEEPIGAPQNPRRVSAGFSLRVR